MNKKKEEGLTLIELLLAMCILTIIISISSSILGSFTKIDKKTSDLKVSTEKLREYISYIKDDARVSESNSDITYSSSEVNQIDFCLREGPEDGEVRYVRYDFKDNKLEIFRTKKGESYTKLNDLETQNKSAYTLTNVSGKFKVIPQSGNNANSKNTLKIYIEEKNQNRKKITSLTETVVIGENL